MSKMVYSLSKEKMSRETSKSNQAKEQLLAEVERLKKELKKKKKYGLVWEPKTEDVVEQCKKQLPVLKEVKNKEIITDKDKPVNLLIEGDNYHALSVLNYTHAGKIDVIYIDPPYNTGIEGFRYNDKIVDREDAFRHSKWLSFMSERLRLSKYLLRDSGIIFISIDDNEIAQIKLLCDEIFGENNLIVNIIWKKRAGAPNDKIIGTTHEYILCYARNVQAIKLHRKKRTEAHLNRYKNPDNHPKGPWAPDNLMANVKGGRYVESLYFPIKNPNTRKLFYPSSHGNWRFNKEKIEELIKNKEIYFGKDGKGRPKLKRFLCDVKEGVPFASIWENVGYNNTATGEIQRFFGTVNIFDTPKPTALMKEILNLATTEGGKEIILDFFAGSGTIGQTVLELNKEDSGNRQFILCTNNENNICTDVCYPRIEKVIEGYKNPKGEKVEGLDGNLKYFKTDFVDYEEPTDKNKIKLTEQATEMLCVKEGTFESVADNKKFKIFKNADHYTGIIFDQSAIQTFKKAIKDISAKGGSASGGKGKFSIYIFSLGDETFDEEFADIKQTIKLSPIPEAILRVYRRIFK